MNYSAYIVCFNNAGTVRAAAESLLGQSVPPAELVVVDDGSNDDVAAAMRGLAARCVRHERNLGRGAARARAMRETNCEFVLCCDATNVLSPDFAQRALGWFGSGRMAAVFGRLIDPAPQGVVGRWRARHLFKQDAAVRATHNAILSTGGAMVRRSLVSRAGGYRPDLRHNEDNDLGARLLAAGDDVVHDPALVARCNVQNSAAQALERYWRWNAAQSGVSLPSYLRQILYSWRVMVRADLEHGDVGAAALSFACPHYCFTRALRRPAGGTATNQVLPP
jgi:glycosyltransferase involved in cell wall biosynthesis